MPRAPWMSVCSAPAGGALLIQYACSHSTRWAPHAQARRALTGTANLSFTEGSRGLGLPARTARLCAALCREVR